MLRMLIGGGTNVLSIVLFSDWSENETGYSFSLDMNDIEIRIFIFMLDQLVFK